MNGKYQYVYEPYNVADAPLHQKIYGTLVHGERGGEIERLSSELDIAQCVITNLIVLLVEKGLLKEADWKTIQGANCEE